MEIFAASYLFSTGSPSIEGGGIAVADGRIVATGTLAELRSAYGCPVTDFSGCVILPGLVNAHTHLELTHFPSWKLRKGIDYAPRTYVDWVIQVIKIKRGLTRNELELSVREGIRIALESGTTAVGDILADRSLVSCHGGGRLGGRLYFEAIGHDEGRCSALLTELRHALDTFPAGRFKAGISPHAPHTLSPRFMSEVTDLAVSSSLPTMVHLAESREELTFLHDSGGKIAELLYPFAGWESYLPPPRRTTPVAYLDSLGVLRRDTAVVHCVHVTPADVEILKHRGVAAVLCPRSNDRLVVGKAPAALLKKAGIPLALGTDSLASNDSLSLWDEMRFLRQVYPSVFTPLEIMEMATIGAARAIRRDDELGTLAPGKRADFLVVRPGATGALSELPEALIEQSELIEVFIGGKQLS
ncbi:amidohydrolase family protein [Geomobilimonas luticola]|uniref:Amidohydrolase family protein n=1 Tax=Geomobilimonas luticola TaxID=1114878 RepID=A0ABS5SEG6_9BACT|nr:amidohydrolase family protein [Geomobilimonas luticola]MBT0652904.1 amidohydrolase family protein [Geomobilimonas luticola]